MARESGAPVPSSVFKPAPSSYPLEDIHSGNHLVTVAMTPLPLPPKETMLSYNWKGLLLRNCFCGCQMSNVSMKQLFVKLPGVGRWVPAGTSDAVLSGSLGTQTSKLSSFDFVLDQRPAMALILTVL